MTLRSRAKGHAWRRNPKVLQPDGFFDTKTSLPVALLMLNPHRHRAHQFLFIMDVSVAGEGVALPPFEHRNGTLNTVVGPRGANRKVCGPEVALAGELVHLPRSSGDIDPIAFVNGPGAAVWTSEDAVEDAPPSPVRVRRDREVFDWGWWIDSGYSVREWSGNYVIDDGRSHVHTHHEDATAARLVETETFIPLTLWREF